MHAIRPLDRPYPPAVENTLAKMMPPNVAPIGLFRTFVRDLPMTQAMLTWGRYELGPQLTLSLRDREILIDRTCARCNGEYEWSVHTDYFADRAGLTPDQVRSLASGSPTDTCWPDRRDRLLIVAADAPHDTATLPDDLGRLIQSELDECQLLDLLLLCGWYQAICFAANAARVELEEHGPRFAQVTTHAG
jgi:hypothetical protein